MTEAEHLRKALKTIAAGGHHRYEHRASCYGNDCHCLRDFIAETLEGVTPQPANLRRYCPKTGRAEAMPERCPRCGHKHPPLAKQDECGSSVHCHASYGGVHTHGCKLPAEHAGQCVPPGVCDRERGR